MKTHEAYKILRRYYPKSDDHKKEYIQLYRELLKQIDKKDRFLLTAHFKKHYYDDIDWLAPTQVQKYHWATLNKTYYNNI